MSSVRRRLGSPVLGAIAAAALVVVGATVVLGPAPGVASAPAATAGACTDATGVTVIVDFGDLGLGAVTRCAPGPVSSGFDALTGAGFTITSVTGQPFLCRIDGEPADDPCNRIPSAASYWSYWHAERGAPWTYSTSGASRTPPAGTVEGWSFGAGDPPGIAPPGPLPTTTSAPPPNPPATAATGAAPTAPTSVATGPDDAAVPGATTTTATPTSEGSTATTAAPGEPADDDRPGEDAEVAAAPSVSSAAPDGGDAGSPAGVVAAAVAVSLLAAAGVRARTRRRSTEGLE